MDSSDIINENMQTDCENTGIDTVDSPVVTETVKEQSMPVKDIDADVTDIEVAVNTPSVKKGKKKSKASLIGKHEILPCACEESSKQDSVDAKPEPVTTEHSVVLLPGKQAILLVPGAPAKTPLPKPTPEVVRCGFCGESGHTVKGPDGEVTCPTLLNNVCTYCKKPGHTNAKCPVAKENHLKKKYGDKYVAPSDDKIRALMSTKIAAPMKADPSTWAAQIAKNIPDQPAIQPKQVVVAKRIEPPKSQELLEWESKYPVHMKRKFGDFWAFLVEGTKYDYPDITLSLRSAINGVTFTRFLCQQFGETWYTSPDFDQRYNCPYVTVLRHEHRYDDFETFMDLLPKPKTIAPTLAVSSKKASDDDEWHTIPGKN